MLSNEVTAAPDETVLRGLIQHFLTFGAKASEDGRWLVDVLPAELQSFFRAEVNAAIREKKAGDAGRAPEDFPEHGQNSQVIFASDYSRVKRKFDRASKAAVRKTDFSVSDSTLDRGF